MKAGSCADHDSASMDIETWWNLTHLNLIQSDSTLNTSQMVPNMWALMCRSSTRTWFMDLSGSCLISIGGWDYLLSRSGCMFAEERFPRGFAISICAGTSIDPHGCHAVNASWVVNFRCPNCPTPQLCSNASIRKEEKNRNSDLQMWWKYVKYVDVCFQLR